MFICRFGLQELYQQHFLNFGIKIITEVGIV